MNADCAQAEAALSHGHFLGYTGGLQRAETSAVFGLKGLTKSLSVGAWE